VADDGPGVSPAQRQAIFEPFVTTRPRGTGLGLPMALRIAESHGGTLAYVADAGLGPGGAGACFRVEIPRQGAAEPARGASRRRAEALA
jgi:signal transduction histidine kinase